MRTYAILYSYPTSDPQRPGERGVRLEAMNKLDALAQIRRGVDACDLCPGAQLVHAKEVARR